jgi:hypothetical protein
MGERREETAGDEKQARGCGVILAMEAAECVGKGWERVSG